MLSKLSRVRHSYLSVFPLHFKYCDWHVWSLNVSGASEGTVCILYRPTLICYNFILIILYGICVHKIDVLDSFYSIHDRPTLIFENHIILKFTFYQIYSKQSGLKAPNYLRKRLNSIPINLNIGPQALLLNDFAVHSTTFARSVRYKVFSPCIKFSRDRKNLTRDYHHRPCALFFTATEPCISL